MGERMSASYNSQRGAASLFVVIFFGILIGVITLSFVTIVSQDQRQATNADLAESAYDSAEAGVQDAIRYLREYDEKGCKGTDTTGYCGNVNKGFAKGNAGDCNVNASGISSNPVPVQVGNDSALRQFYTCVKVKRQTPDYKETLYADQSSIVQLKTADASGNPVPLTSIKLNWFSKRDLPSGSLSLRSVGDTSLPKNSQDWGANTPPILRVELIPTARGSIDINNLDADSRTYFLYPRTGGKTNIDATIEDEARRGEKVVTPIAVGCPTTYGDYNCSVDLNNLPAATGTNAAGTEYYVRLTSVYHNTDFQMILSNGLSTVNFDGVSPEIDSTGRANDLFRHIQQRIVYQTDSSNLAKYGGFDVTHGICKDFNIANKDPQYENRCPNNLSSLGYTAPNF